LSYSRYIGSVSPRPKVMIKFRVRVLFSARPMTRASVMGIVHVSLGLGLGLWLGLALWVVIGLGLV
jgi:hypothetical protein